MKRMPAWAASGPTSWALSIMRGLSCISRSVTTPFAARMLSAFATASPNLLLPTNLPYWSWITPPCITASTPRSSAAGWSNIVSCYCICRRIAKNSISLKSSGIMPSTIGTPSLSGPVIPWCRNSKRSWMGLAKPSICVIREYLMPSL